MKQNHVHHKSHADEIPFYARNYRPSKPVNLDVLAAGGSCGEEDTMIVPDLAAGTMNPYSVYLMLRKQIFKQDRYLQDLSMFCYNHSRGIRQTMLVTGPSGCGKTEALRCLQKMTDIEIKICDGSLVSKQSYKGDYKVTDMIKAETSRPIIVIDEFDKILLAERGSELLIQGELLKIIEGGSIQVSGDNNEKYDVDTSKMSFILIGSFQQFEQQQCDENKCSGLGFDAVAVTPKPFEKDITIEMLVKSAGLFPELAGRIMSLTSVEPFSKQDFENIIFNESTSPLTKIEKSYGYKLEISRSELKRIADDAYDEALGIRGITNKLVTLLNSQIFRDFQSGKECGFMEAFPG